MEEDVEGGMGVIQFMVPFVGYLVWLFVLHRA